LYYRGQVAFDTLLERITRVLFALDH
jgi:hypothetical protein